MKKSVVFFILALTVSTVLTQSTVAQTTWNADPMHSKLTFSITHLGISDVDGMFTKFDASATTNKPDFSDAVFELAADVTSINTAVEMRDKHLRSADFFEVERFPKMTFKSTGIKKIATNKYQLTGNLTLHGVTKAVMMDLWYRGTIVDPKSKVNISGFQLTGTIKRSDFGIGPKFPAPMLSDEVKIKADGEFKQK
ncbi:polyisoprenoid-binding protein YceI [Pedobacter sp. CG_S7]|uniref:YceI family protein n=1 Tax=Pedobacter sp. CG_S7 TaxID=3143930 RepID=UPI0033931DFA